MFPKKIALKEMNPHLICTLCGGYFIDATTIIECLHSFCKSCIVKHLASSKYCPVCEVQVHKTQPLENIRPDHILQEIVYKLVPGLYQNEMRCRRDFYRKHQEDVPVSSEAKGEIPDDCSIFLPDESIMLSLEYNSENANSCQSSCGKRYLQCPAAITIVHLQKLIRSKFGLSSDCQVDFFCSNMLLPGFLTLLDIAYIFQWRRKTPLHLSYHILESKSQIVKLTDEKTEPMETSVDSGKISNSPEPDTAVIPKTTPVTPIKTEAKWQEVQLQISENGVVSAAAPMSSTSQKCVKEEDIDSSQKCIKKEDIISTLVCVKEEDIKSTKLEVKTEGPKIVAPKTDEKAPGHSEKLKADVKEKSVEPAPKPESKKELVEVAPAVKPVAKTTVTKSTVANVTSAKDVKKAEPAGSEAVKIDSSISQTSKVNTTAKVQSEVCKTNETKSKVKEAVQVKGESVERKMETSVEVNAKPKSARSCPQTTDNAKKVCKVEPSLMGLPCGLSITQRPALKTYAGLKQPKPSKEDEVKGMAGLSKEVSVKPILSVSMSPAPPPNKTDYSCLPKIPSSTTPIVPPSKKQTPIRYKTLKSPTVTWNPSIPRSSMLMMKHNNPDKDPDQPAKFFKTRNVPRYLGNPASGVKPMYQASEASPKNSETPPGKNFDLNSQKSSSSSVTLMKIDPKTLSPIVVPSACSSPSPSPIYSPSSHLKKPSLPPSYIPSSPKQSPTSKSKPVVNNKTPAHSTSIPSPAHSSSLLTSNPFFNPANPLMYPGFPHPFSHPDSTNRLLAGGTNSTNLIRAMSSLCSPAAAFHPSLPQSLSMLFNAHQVGFPRLSSSTNKSALKSLPPKQMSPAVSAPSSHTPLSKPKKPVPPVPPLETSRYSILHTNGLPSPSESKVSSNAESAFKSKFSVKPSIPVDKKDQVERMEVDPSKKETKSISDCDRKLSVSSNKRLKRDDSVESNFKEGAVLVSKQPAEGTVASPPVLKDSLSDSKSKSSLVSRPDQSSEKKSNPVSNESRDKVNCSGKQNETKNSDKSSENTSISSKVVAEKVSSVTSKVESVIENKNSGHDRKGKFDDGNLSKTVSEVSSKPVSKPEVSLKAMNNNNETSSSGTKNIPNLVSADLVPQVN